MDKGVPMNSSRFSQTISHAVQNHFQGVIYQVGLLDLDAMPILTFLPLRTFSKRSRNVIH